MIEQVKDIIPGVLSGFLNPVFSNRQLITNKWEEIAGPKIAPHTRPSLTPEGHLFVWVDRSSLAFELSQRYARSLLKRVQAVLGEENVKSIRFRVGQLR